MDVWSRQELERLVEKLAERGLVSNETAEGVREALDTEGFQTAFEELQTAGVFSTPEHDDGGSQGPERRGSNREADSRHV